LPDGRTYNHARAAALLMTTLTTMGLGIASASPASAASSTTSLDAAQNRAERLSHQAEVVRNRHDHAQSKLSHTRTQIAGLTKAIQRQNHVMDALRAQVASTVVGQYVGTGGASAPASTELSHGSEVLLTNVTVVSEDTGSRGDALTRTNAQLEKLDERRTALSGQVAALSGVEHNLRTQQQTMDSRAATATAELDRLEKKAAADRMARLGGPVLAYAKSQVGKSYVFGAAGPNAFDCSGLTMMAWAQSGVSLPHSSSAQYNSGRHISESELQPGDLVFYYSPISHVGLYIGNGQIVNALNPGAGVKISGLHDMPYSGAVRPG
jgi:cell wall-associated NlpC family hydrolase